MSLSNQTPSKEKLEQSMALIAIFQSAMLVQRLSQGEPLPDDALNASIYSIFVLDPDNIQEIFPEPAAFHEGIKLLESAFMRPNDPQAQARATNSAERGTENSRPTQSTSNVVSIRDRAGASRQQASSSSTSKAGDHRPLHANSPLPTLYVRQAIRYVLGLIYLEQKISNQPDNLNIIRSRLQQCLKQVEFIRTEPRSQEHSLNETSDHHSEPESLKWSEYTHPKIIENLAQIYLDTAGNQKFRIQVLGQSSILKKPANADKIRAILLAGLRAAMLWRQLGGRRWQLVFSRKQLLSCAHHLKRYT